MARASEARGATPADAPGRGSTGWAAPPVLQFEGERRRCAPPGRSRRASATPRRQAWASSSSAGTAPEATHFCPRRRQPARPPRRRVPGSRACPRQGFRPVFIVGLPSETVRGAASLRSDDARGEATIAATGGEAMRCRPGGQNPGRFARGERLDEVDRAILAGEQRQGRRPGGRAVSEQVSETSRSRPQKRAASDRHHQRSRIRPPRRRARGRRSSPSSAKTTASALVQAGARGRARRAGRGPRAGPAPPAPTLRWGLTRGRRGNRPRERVGHPPGRSAQRREAARADADRRARSRPKARDEEAKPDIATWTRSLAIHVHARDPPRPAARSSRASPPFRRGPDF